jgi:hypothetical protein
LVAARDRALQWIETRELAVAHQLLPATAEAADETSAPPPPTPIPMEPPADDITLLRVRIASLQYVRDAAAFNARWSAIIATLQPSPPISRWVLEPLIVEVLAGALVTWLPPEGQVLDPATSRTLASLGDLFEWRESQERLLGLLPLERRKGWVVRTLMTAGQPFLPRPPLAVQPAQTAKGTGSSWTWRWSYLLLVFIFMLIRYLTEHGLPAYNAPPTVNSYVPPASTARSTQTDYSAIERMMRQSYGTPEPVRDKPPLADIPLPPDYKAPPP